MKPIAMKRVFVFILTASACVFAQGTHAQGPRKVWISQNRGPGPVTVGVGAFGGASSAPIQGSPYSATITNESVQTLADGNRIVENSTGTIARDSGGRTRRDLAMPPIGNLPVAKAPHLVFIQDPVAQASYTLNLTDKTAHKMPMPPPGAMTGASGPGMPSDVFFVQVGDGPGPLPPPLPNSAAVSLRDRAVLPADEGIVGMAGEQGQVQGQVVVADGQMSVTGGPGQVTTEDLGSQTMEGVFVTGKRTTRTIPAGQIGNEKPISIVTEVWTSPDLKTIVYSKRSDPRMGEQTFQLTNIARSEPDASLFTVPADFKIVEGPKPILYRQKQ